MSEVGLSKTRLLSALTQSPHGKLEQYYPVAVPAATTDPDFFGHVIAWSEKHSEVKDVRVALPVIALATATDPALRENAAAHLALLDPRLFARALAFGRQTMAYLTPTPQIGKTLARLTGRYLRDLETRHPAEWTRVALQHRQTLKGLYARHHLNAGPLARQVILQGEAPAGTVFHAVRHLGTMTPQEAAGAILKFKIPFLVAQGALKDRLTSPDVVLALIRQMSPAELVTNAKFLEKLGVTKVPALRAAFEAAIGAAGTSKKRKPTLKTGRAAAQVGDDAMRAKLQALQERQLDRVSIDGDWLVLGDKSGSMDQAIVTACEIAAVLARSVTGRVHLVFFDTTPRHIDATGKTLDELRTAIRLMRAEGNTSIGAGLLWALDRKIKVDGIAVISDGAENTPPLFALTYEKYAAMFDTLPPIYFYLLHGQGGDSQQVLTGNCARRGLDVQVFDLRAGVDYYSLPAVVQTMRTNRYGLIDDVLAVPLKRLDEVLPRTTKMEVFRHGIARPEELQV